MATPTTISRVAQNVMPLLRKLPRDAAKKFNPMEVFAEAKPAQVQHAATPSAPSAVEQESHPLAKNFIAMRLYAKSGRCH